MANTGPVRKPRIRKSAPTIRERAEAARLKAEEPKPRRIRTTLSKAGRPIKKVKAPKGAARVLRPIGKALSWLVPKYLVNSWREVRLVTWPGRGETWRLTTAVFIFAAIFGILVTVVDKLLDLVFKNLVLK